MATKTKCKFCDKFFTNLDDYASHMEKKHVDMIPEDMSARQFVYYLKTGMKAGKCVMCKKPTTWNEKTNKYNRFCDNPKCKEEYRKIFKDRMMNKYGKITLLNDPEQQRKMLQNRKISGHYQWSDYKHKIPYTGSYERSFLEFMDKIMDYPAEDIIAPSPHNYVYEYNGEKHFYFPDFYVPSLNLEIEIKDGGDNPNNHPKIQEVDKEKERLKDEVLSSSSIPFNYLKICNKKHVKFLQYLEKVKEQELKGIDKKITMI